MSGAELFMNGKESRKVRMMVSGGGTGGHLFPGIAVAEEMRRRCPAGAVLFVTTGRNIDSVGLKRRNLPAVVIRSQGVKGKGFAAGLKSILQLPLSLFDAIAAIRRFKPDIVFGVGGYVTGPVLLAAKLLGKATCIHEQNSVPGVTNKILGRIVDRVFLSIPGSEAYFKPSKVRMTGNPVRSELIAAAGTERRNGPTMLVLGGSQGAHRVNTLVIGALDKLFNRLPTGMKVIHQTGVQDERMVRDAYKRLGIDAEVAAFFTDMAEVYSSADLVVSRAGATTLAELTVMKRPSILVPFPYATDDHQRLNALYLTEAGAARMFLEQDLTDIVLGKDIVQLLEDADLRQRMAERSAGLARPKAVNDIVEACLELVAERRSSASKAAAGIALP